MNRKSFSLLVITLIFGGLLISAAWQTSTAQTGTSFNGIISADTIWTKANSPYTLTGPVSIAQGVTLTIEPGVVVQSPGSGPYTIQVNGTLRAIGALTDKIQFNKITSITFTAASKGYDEKTGAGSIIQNAIADSSPIILESPAKIDHNLLNGNEAMFGVVGGNCGVISNNTVNALYGNGIGCSGNASVLNNTVSGAPWGGISIGLGSPLVMGNLVTGCMGFGGVMAQGGIVITSDGSTSGVATPTIQENTVTGNSVGLSIAVQFGGQAVAPTIINNNFYGNQKYNVYLFNYPYNFSLGANWWGTTDQQAIAQTMYDYHSNYNLGYITFTQFLTKADAVAPSAQFDPNPTPTPTPSPTATPSPTPTVTPTTTPTTTATPTSTPTPTATATPTSQPTTTPTATPTNAPSPTANPTNTPTKTPTSSPTPTVITTPTASPTPTGTSSDMPVTAIVIAVVAVCVVAGVFVLFKVRKKA